MKRSVSFSFIMAMLGCVLLNAQLPSPTYFYYHTTSGAAIYNYNTATDVSTLNTISLPAGNIGFAVNNNFFSATPAMTFYTVVGGTYYYYNGSNWVNTGHTAGAVNIGGAGPYIYSFNGSSGQIYRYNGTGPAVLVYTIPAGSFGGPYDVTGDASGNFFIMKTSSAPHNVKQYSPTGVLLTTYSMVGFPNGTAGGGFAFINGKLYADISGTRVWGTISGTTITYGGPLTLSTSPGDFANWPLSIVPLPIELISFTGAYNPETRMNDLEWVTATKSNNSHFTVECSKDAITWEFVSMLDGAGNSNTSQAYQLSHNAPYNATYYRLTQTDYNGHTETFEPILVIQPAAANGNDFSWMVYPNPASYSIVMETNFDQEYEVVITDETGRVQLAAVVSEKKHTLAVEHLESGLYFITSNVNGVKRTLKWIKM